MIKEIFNFFMIAGIILGAFFIVATTLSKKGSDKSIIYLNLVILFLTLNNLQIWLADNGFVEVNFSVRKLLIPWYMLILPSYYTFLTYYLKIEKKIYSFERLSVVLFVIQILVRMFVLPFYYTEKNYYWISQYSQIEEIFNACFTLFLFIKAFILLFKYSKLYEFVLSFDNIKWLKNFMFLGSIVMLLWVVAIVLNLDKVMNPEIYIYYPMRLSCSIVLYWIGYQGFFNYSLLKERIKLREAIAILDNKEKPIVNEAVTQDPIFIDQSENDEKRFQQIKSHIETGNRFLEPNFSLEMLSDETEINVNKLSQIINSKTNFNFSDFINQFRVEKAKSILTAPEYSEYTIVSIGLECGFNSKSAFYNAFKKFTLLTPTEFKQQKGK